MTDPCARKAAPEPLRKVRIALLILATAGLVAPVAIVAAPAAARDYVHIWRIVLGYDANPFEHPQSSWDCLPTVDGKKTNRLPAKGK
ncbi:hypothetical protein RLW55_01265 [Hyphomicrobium sp. B1]|uniref:hypothetical protein n=1 Tax=unclassified Hyphomicrobium TaxID=2619925 RepID=UPI00391DDF2D